MTKSVFFMVTDLQADDAASPGFAGGSSHAQPLYLRLYEAIAAAVRDGRLAQGEKLPSLRNVSARLGLSRNTVEGAYAQLVSEGYMENRPRCGYFVCSVEPLFSPPLQTPPIVLEQFAGSPAAEPAAEKQIDLSSNRIDASLFPVSVLRRLYRAAVSAAAAGDILQRGEAAGDAAFRTAIARYLREARGVRCEAAQIIVGAGSEYLLPLAVRFLKSGAADADMADLDKAAADKSRDGKYRFAVEDPGYEKTRLLLDDCGCRVVPLPLDAAGLSAAALTASRARAVYVTPAHQFPTGIVMPVTRRFELLNWAAKTNSWIIEDDYDSDYRYSGRQVPALQGLEDGGRVLYLGTFSRSLSPSIRVGYLVLPEPLAGMRQRLCERYSCTVSRLEQAVLASFINGGYFERHINRTRRMYRTRRDAAIAALHDSVPGIRISGAEAGLHFIAEIPFAAIPDGEFTKRAAAAGLIVKTIASSSGQTPQTDAADSGLPEQAGRYLRLIIGYAHLNEMELRSAADILGQIVRSFA